MLNRSHTSLITSFVLLMIVWACSGCSYPPPTPSEYAEAVLLTAKRDQGDLNIELSLPPRTDGYIETYSVSVAPEGEQFGRHLQSETSRAHETTNKRSMSTELTERELAEALDVKVEFAVWKHEGIHRDRELFRDVKVITVPLAADISEVE